MGQNIQWRILAENSMIKRDITPQSRGNVWQLFGPWMKFSLMYGDNISSSRLIIDCYYGCNPWKSPIKFFSDSHEKSRTTRHPLIFQSVASKENVVQDGLSRKEPSSISMVKQQLQHTGTDIFKTQDDLFNWKTLLKHPQRLDWPSIFYDSKWGGGGELWWNQPSSRGEEGWWNKCVGD